MPRPRAFRSPKLQPNKRVRDETNRRHAIAAGRSGSLSACCFATVLPIGRARAAEEVLPKHINRETLKAVRDGLDFLARTQGGDGGWHDSGGQAYPVAVSALAGMALLAGGNTPTRGHYAQQVKQVTEFLLELFDREWIADRPEPGEWPADARPRLRADVPGVGLWDGIESFDAQAAPPTW